MLWLLASLSLTGTLGPEVQLAPRGGFASAAHLQWDPSVATDGTDFFVVWSDKRNEAQTHATYGARIRRDGLVLDPAGIKLGPVHSDEVNATYIGGGRYAIAWSFAGGIQARILASDGTWASPVIDVGGGYCSDISGANGRFAVTWYDGEIAVRRYDSNGTALDAAPVQVSTGLTSGTTCARIRADGSTPPAYLVEWRQGQTLLSSYVGATGAPGAPVTMHTGTGELVVHDVVHAGGPLFVSLFSDFDGGVSPLLARRYAIAMGHGAPETVWPGAAPTPWAAAGATGADGRVRSIFTLGDYGSGGFATNTLPLMSGGAFTPGPSAPQYLGDGLSMA
ncbi:MAG: hypothetical protein JNK82_09835, partial [Myxococcaceae bacterium]|nr:hypothetical protein [Myxococcaceae bacterium]